MEAYSFLKGNEAVDLGERGGRTGGTGGCGQDVFYERRTKKKIEKKTCLVRDIFQLLNYVQFFLPTPNYYFPQVLKAVIILGGTLRKKKPCFFFNHYPFYFSITTE